MTTPEIPAYRPRTPPLYFDAEAMAEDVFGGRQALHEALQKAGYKIARRSLDKWFTRSRIPGDWWPRLFYTADQHGRTLDPRRYLKVNDKYNPNGREIAARRKAMDAAGLAEVATPDEAAAEFLD